MNLTHAMQGSAREVGERAPTHQGKNGQLGTFSVIVSDLDGTMTPSYKSLDAIHAAKVRLTDLGCNSHDTDMFIRMYLGGQIPVGGKQICPQQVLHLPYRPQEAIQVWLNGTSNLRQYAEDRTIVSLMDQLQRQSFVLYPDVHRWIDTVKESGALFIVYTNSPGYFAMRRMAIAGINPDHIDCIYARADGAISSDFMTSDPDLDKRTTDTIRALYERFIPFTFRKPSPVPLQAIAETLDVPYNQLLMIGESHTDFECANPHASDPAAVFALQEQGAAGICDDTIAINQAIRPGAEALGLAAANGSIAQRGIEDKIIRLPEGFSTLLQLHARGKIELIPSAPLSVSNNALIAHRSSSHSLGPAASTRRVNYLEHAFT